MPADVVEAFHAGTLRLQCETTCVLRWNANSRRIKALYDNKVWTDLAKEVGNIDYASDLSYFYLGRAAEGLGRPEVAATYYRLALSQLRSCQSWSSDCDGFDFPRDIRMRLAALPVTKPSPQSVSSATKSLLGTPSLTSSLKREPYRSGTGFFINAEGLMVTSWHVVENATSIAVSTQRDGKQSAQLLGKDAKCDLAVLKVAPGAQNWLPIHRATKRIKRGSEVMTVGFPRVSVQGFESKVTNGLISSLSGVGNDPKIFQISVPIQPGNSGGPLVARDGLVVGVVSAKLAVQATLDTANIAPENVNYAVKSSCLLDLIRTLPGKHRFDAKRLKTHKSGRKTRNKSAGKEMTLVDLTERVEKTVVLVTATLD